MAAKPGLRIGSIDLSRHPEAIDADARVVKTSRIAGAKFDRRERSASSRPAPGSRSCGRRPSPAAWSGYGVRQRQDQIRLAELPALGPGRNRRAIGGLAFRRSVLDPLLDHRDLVVTKPALVGERDVAWLGKPRRHDALPGCLRDLLGVGANVAILQQRERGTGKTFRVPVGSAAVGRVDRAMAGGALLEQDGRDVLVERRRRSATVEMAESAERGPLAGRDPGTRRPRPGRIECGNSLTKFEIRAKVRG